MAGIELTQDESAIDVGTFLASPRHGHHFRHHADTRKKITNRREELHQTHGIAGKRPIINLQQQPRLIELHDGNASVVAWWLFCHDRRARPTLGLLLENLPHVILLRNRIHTNGETWHPFVPLEVACAERLQQLEDPEQGRRTCQALDLTGKPVYFDDEGYFAGIDTAEPIATIGAALV